MGGAEWAAPLDTNKNSQSSSPAKEERPLLLSLRRLPAAGPASPGRGGVCVSPRTRVAARGGRARRQRGGRVAAA